MGQLLRCFAAGQVAVCEELQHFGYEDLLRVLCD